MTSSEEEEEEEVEKEKSAPSKKKKKQKNWLKEDTAGKAVHISAAGAQAAAESAGSIGPQGLATIGQAAPVLQVAAVAYDAYQIGRNVEKDRRRGTTRNTAKKVTTTVATYSAGIGGAVAGAAIGSAIFPGVGTIVGGILGGLTGGIGGGFGSGKAAEAVMDRAEYDSVRAKCATCQRTFLCRKYLSDDDKNCDSCQEK